MSVTYTVTDRFVKCFMAFLVERELRKFTHIGISTPKII
jgi:hypothetical protein